MQFSVPHYRQDFYLEENQGNNGFDFRQRSEVQPDPRLRIASLIHFTSFREALSALLPSPATTFELEIDGRIKSFAGLKNFLIFPNPERPDRPVVIIDNHNHAFYFWHWAKLTFRFSTPLPLIHIDQHKDSRIPSSLLTPEDSEKLDKVFEYTNRTLNVGNFIPPAIKSGLIEKPVTIDSSSSLDNFTVPEKPYLLDIDLDFFAPEFDYIDRNKKISIIQKLLPLAELVTIATSPYFIDQSAAGLALREIFQK